MFSRFLKTCRLLALSYSARRMRARKARFDDLRPRPRPSVHSDDSPQQPGAVTPAAPTTVHTAENAYSRERGKRLFSAYNCEGCHFLGGWRHGAGPDG